MRKIAVVDQAGLEAAASTGNVPVIAGDGQYSVSRCPQVVIRGSARPVVVIRGDNCPRVVVREASQPRVMMYGTSRSLIMADGSSQPRVEVWGGSRPRIEAWELSQPHVVAWENSRPHIVAWEDSRPRVEAWETSQPHVEAWGDSRPHVVARGSSRPRVSSRVSGSILIEAMDSSQLYVVSWRDSRPHVVASGYAQISARGGVDIDAGPTVAVCVWGTGAQVTGGMVARIDTSTPEGWCDYYGLPVRGGVVTLFKAVRHNWRSRHGVDYTPGTIPRARDWDGGAQECGGGLHFSPTPAMASIFDDEATRYVACPVRLAEMAVHPDGEYPEKCKSAGCCGPVQACDREGRLIAE